MTSSTVRLPSGDDLPKVGLGTWDIDGATVRASVRAALDGDYTHVDTAEGYRNEREIGETLADYDREELFLTSKVLPANLNYGSVIESCEDSLDRLGTDYLDLYLIHWPNPAISLRETLDAMKTLSDDGKVRNVGVSNFSGYQLSNALHVTDVPIAVNQIEFHPWFQRRELVDYCQSNGVAVEAAAPLGRTEVLQDSTIQDIAATYDKSPAQIVLKWAVEKDVVVLPKSSSATHIAENGTLFDWELDAEDQRRIDGLDRNRPVYDTLEQDWSREVYGIPE
ncbi:aldo/keto reductase [Haloferax sp. ATB1]|uniref:aldo/keto reductase n=1 Tax=Haloferax sp. ATB1 TaxID=1508454 RepID=UPI0005B21C8B|nr:aldo/keto reductase [Haloferax sp. ATB1]